VPLVAQRLNNLLLLHQTNPLSHRADTTVPILNRRTLSKPAAGKSQRAENRRANADTQRDIDIPKDAKNAKDSKTAEIAEGAGGRGSM